MFTTPRSPSQIPCPQSPCASPQMHAPVLASPARHSTPQPPSQLPFPQSPYTSPHVHPHQFASPVHQFPQFFSPLNSPQVYATPPSAPLAPAAPTTKEVRLAMYAGLGFWHAGLQLQGRGFCLGAEHTPCKWTGPAAFVQTHDLSPVARKSLAEIRRVHVA